MEYVASLESRHGHSSISTAAEDAHSASAGRDFDSLPIFHLEAE